MDPTTCVKRIEDAIRYMRDAKEVILGMESEIKVSLTGSLLPTVDIFTFS